MGRRYRSPPAIVPGSPSLDARSRPEKAWLVIVVADSVTIMTETAITAAHTEHR
jgi:hypothetical protein